jgi:tetratricopeptide (TPR) repeat protein
LANSPDQLLEKAQAALASGHPDQALSLFRTCLQQGVGTVMVWANVVQLEEQLNRLQAARSALRDALKHVGRHPMLTLVEARLLRREGQPEEADALLKTLNGSSFPPWFQAARDYEWCRNLDRLGRHDEAFAKAESANRITRTLWPPAWPGALNQWLDWLMREPPAAAEDDDEAPPPVFLMGFPRSGTTLLDQMLDSHSRIRVLDEWPLMEKLSQTMPAPWYRQASWKSGKWLARARDDYRQMAVSALGEVWTDCLVDKMPLNVLFLPLIKAVFPRARIVVARRHPLDACLSAFMQEFRAHVSLVPFLDIEETANYWNRLDQLLGNWQEAFPEDVLMVPYEHLVEDPKGTLDSVMLHLGIPAEPQQYEPHVHARAKAKINTPSYHQVIQPIYRDALGRWRHYRKALEPVFPVVRDRAAAHGYAVD